MMICLVCAVFPYGLRNWFDHLGYFSIFHNEHLILLAKIAFVGIIFCGLYLFALYITKTLDDDDKNTLHRWLMIHKIKTLLS